MSVERDRLEKLYDGFSDEELLGLDRDKENLTEDARAALEALMFRRGLESVVREEAESGFGPAIPGIVGGSAEAMGLALDPSGVEAGGLVVLIGFYDGHELGRAVGFLQEAEIEHEIRPLAGDALSGASTRYDVMVGAEDVEDGQRLLRQTMGLFPLPEVSEEDADLDDGAMQELGSFETMADAEQAVAILAAKGVESKIIEPTNPNDPDDWFVVLVKTGEFARALQVLVDGLGMIE